MYFDPDEIPADLLEYFEVVPGTAPLTDQWLLGPEPSREEHYAAFPSEIPKRCILAGTSAKGQCPACGAPWVRVVERTSMVVRRTDWGEKAGNRTASSGTMVTPPSSKTVDWQPSCSCDAGDPVPQTVLDPFLGSGTTLLVASRLERSGVGIELSPTYARMAEDRIRRDVGPMFPDEVQVPAVPTSQPPLLALVEEGRASA